ncbi:MAG: TonB-dependent receptor [Nitrospirota bacterium]|nr:TonB-dependent receptor [Nitrospirota bacterium]
MSSIAWRRAGWERGFALALVWAIVLPANRSLAVETEVPNAEQLAKGALELSLEELMNIEVTSAGKKAQRLEETASAIFVITGEDIKRGGFRSIPEALRLAPGVEVSQINANQWAITIRGFNSPFANKLLVLIDGRSVYTPLFGGVFWDVQDVLLEDVDRIEVIRGPGGTLWGQNAVNGVINVITKKAAATQGTFVEAGAGNLERGFTSARHGGKLGEQGEDRVYGKFFNRNSYANPNGTAAYDQWDQARVGFRTDLKLTGRDSLTVQGDGYSGSEQNDARGASLTQPFLPIIPNSTQVGGGNLLARWTRQFSSTSDLTVQTYVDRTQRDNLFIGENRTTYDLDVQHRFQPLDRHDIVWGAAYQLSHDNIANNFRLSFAPPSYNFQVVSWFAQDEVTLVPQQLRLIAGAKALYNTFTGMEYQPNGRLLWTPHEHHTLWLAVSRAVRLPTRADDAMRLNAGVSSRTGVPPLTMASTFGNPNAGAEDMVAYELGYRTQVTPAVTFDVTSFYNVYRNLLVGMSSGTAFVETNPSPAHVVTPFQNMNQGSGHTYGVEVTSAWQAAKAWRLSANYSWLRMEINAINTANANLDPGLNPKQQFRIRSQYDVVENLQWDTGIYYTDGLMSNMVASYTRVDTRLAWRVNQQIDAELVGQNLFDKSHFEWQPIGAGALYQSSAIPRSFFVRLAWHY